jgi:hypothetical protein
MPENVLQTLQQFVQDVLAPDVRETKVRLESFAKETDTRFIGLEKQIAGLEKQIASASKEGEAQYKSILAAIAEAKAQSELSNMSEIYALRERVAVLESRHN